MQPGVAQCPTMGLLAGGHRHLGGSHWTRARPPGTARPSRGSTLQPLDAAMAATPQPISSSAPTTTHSTRCNLDDSARARPLAATAAAGMAGMATSWRTGRQHLNQTARTTACSQSTSGPLARFPIGARQPRHQPPPLGDLLVAEPSPTRASTSRLRWVSTNSKTDSHPARCRGQAAAWNWTRAWLARAATRSGPSTGGSSPSMLGSRRADTTGTPFRTTLPPGDVGAMDSHNRHHHHA
jgi:hypothetical protein